MSLDGNLVKGSWRKLGTYNTLIIEIAGRSELFDLRFLNADFLVLTKHGDQGRKGQRRFFCLIHERSAGELDWRNVMEKMFNVWRENSLSLWAWVVFIAILGLIAYLSVN